MMSTPTCQQNYSMLKIYSTHFQSFFFGLVWFLFCCFNHSSMVIQQRWKKCDTQRINWTNVFVVFGLNAWIRIVRIYLRKKMGKVSYTSEKKEKNREWDVCYTTNCSPSRIHMIMRWNSCRSDSHLWTIE